MESPTQTQKSWDLLAEDRLLTGYLAESGSPEQVEGGDMGPQHDLGKGIDPPVFQRRVTLCKILKSSCVAEWL